MPLLPKMVRSFRSSFVRLMFAGFLALSVLILAAGMIISVVGVDQARSQVVDSYGTSIQVVANALRDQLSDAEALASISLLEDELIRLLCKKDTSAIDLWFQNFSDWLTQKFRTKNFAFIQIYSLLGRILKFLMKRNMILRHWNVVCVKWHFLTKESGSH